MDSISSSCLAVATERIQTPVVLAQLVSANKPPNGSAEEVMLTGTLPGRLRQRRIFVDPSQPRVNAEIDQCCDS